jgi:hypothetical protein
MNEAEVFVPADRTLNRVVAMIADDQWDIPVPADFARARSDHTPTLREICQLPRIRRRLGAGHARRAHHGRGRQGQVQG